ncbi:hypothetical protein [uncultured Corynebacterium sp.]|uniref:hypothetical protein n=1 Tax=uncultured Corynebacterium sp. TaxID=159447 RepID=UPI002625B0F6|nr:hypothetical protein [uncultured Corynebacterium sp.]
MIQLTNQGPHLANGTQWDVNHDGKKIGTLTVSKYENLSDTPYWQAKLSDEEGNLIARGEMTHAMPDMEDLAVWAGHAINLEKHDVIAADLKDPYGRKHRIVWRAVEITGHDEALENLDVRSFIWGTKDDAPIRWKLVNDENGGRYVAEPTAVSPRGDISWPVESREVEPGEILEPGDFYIWRHR